MGRENIADPPMLMSFLRQRLASHKIGRYLTLVAVLLTIPALFHGFEVDDRLQRAGILREGKLSYLGRNPGNLYTFLDGDPAYTKNLMDQGIATWWTDPQARLSFFRPISSLLLWADHLFLKSAWLIHAHSIVWYVATILVALALYRRFLTEKWAIGLAGFMFAVDHTHGLAAAWIAQRNTLVAGFLSLLTLFFHDRARRDEGRSRDAIFAAISMGAALFSAEAGLGVLPYLFVHAFVFDRPRWLRALWPFAIPLLLWAVVYKLGGYGAHGSGVYVDPADDPVGYLANVFRNWPILAATELGMPGADFYPFLPLYAKAAMIAFATLAVGLFMVALRPLLAKDPIPRFFVLGGILCLLPSCATIPGSRLTFLASFGLLGALAQIVVAWYDRAEWFPASGWARMRAMPVVLWCGMGHIFLSPLVFVFSMHQMTIFETVVSRLAQGLPKDPQLEKQRVIVVNAPEPAFCAYVMITQNDAGLPTPGKMFSMSSGARDMELKRTDESTVLLSSKIGLVQPGTDLLSRGDRPFAVGYRVDLSDLSIEITRVNAEGWPVEAKFMFAKPLENDGYRWMQWQNQTLAPLTLPKIGESLSFPGQIIQLF